MARQSPAMHDLDPEDSDDFIALEALDDRRRAALIVRLQEQFTENVAVRMCDIGVAELQGPLHVAAGTPGGGPFAVEFTRSALADWQCLRGDTKPSFVETLGELQTGIGAGPGIVRLPRNDSFLLRRGPIRWVFHRNLSESRVIIFGLGVWAINPLQKVWRYFSQKKAEDLITRSELYLRRLDRLVDAFEATPTFAMYEDHRRQLLGSLGFAADHHLDFFDYLRRALYVSCWQKSEHESFAMWKNYCPDDGGCALQTTDRRLHHEHWRISQSKNLFHLKSVRYIDHASEPAFLADVSDPAFLKARWYSEEKEIRFAALRIDAAAGGTAEDTERKLAALPDHEWIGFDLDRVTEHVVFNPAASLDKRQALLALIRLHRPFLEPRINASALESAPMRRGGA